MGLLVFALRGEFPGGLIRQLFVGPDLTMRMRIASAHECAAVLKNLHVPDPGKGAELPILVRPHVNDLAQFLRLHAGYGQIVTRRKTDHPADTSLAASDDQPALIDFEVS